ncbi:MAG: DUF2971 domain-containing protein [Saccharospirillaceae bacterium]|nr:DUF2971 domain-containing protein [Saccharospirillaceae bacterium]MCD8530898.1 DUF2971 domain-containing protein [Saccharospirillaceae bacterium]
MPIETVYKYRCFSPLTIDSLCRDKLFFASPETFNDPLDCKPTLEIDSTSTDLKKLLFELIRLRTHAETIASMKQLKINKSEIERRASALATKRAEAALEKTLTSIYEPFYTEPREEVELRFLKYEINSEILKRYDKGICCFSSEFDNPLLWSHYGDEHRGICIGYDLIRKPTPDLRKVIYGGSRTIKTSVIINALLKGNQRAKTLLDNNVLLRKAKPWSYEKEYRLIGDVGLHESPLRLKEIYFGLRCPTSVIHTVTSVLYKHRGDVNFYQISNDQSSFKLHHKELDDEELAFYPRVARSGIEIFGDPTIDQQY